MTQSIEPISEAMEAKTTAFLMKLMKLGNDVHIDPTAELTEQIGLDSIEAFDAIATLHELLDLPIPDDLNPKVVNSIRSLSN
jgi:acyl carrier protein